jgi:hypothetical protein
VLAIISEILPGLSVYGKFPWRVTVARWSGSYLLNKNAAWLVIRRHERPASATAQNDSSFDPCIISSTIPTSFVAVERKSVRLYSRHDPNVGVATAMHPFKV